MNTSILFRNVDLFEAYLVPP